MQKRVEFMSFELLIQSLSDTASGRFCADLAHSDLPPHIKSFKGCQNRAVYSEYSRCERVLHFTAWHTILFHFVDDTDDFSKRLKTKWNGYSTEKMNSWLHVLKAKMCF